MTRYAQFSDTRPRSLRLQGLLSERMTATLELAEVMRERVRVRVNVRVLVRLNVCLCLVFVVIQQRAKNQRPFFAVAKNHKILIERLL